MNLRWDDETITYWIDKTGTVTIPTTRPLFLPIKFEIKWHIYPVTESWVLAWFHWSSYELVH